MARENPLCPYLVYVLQSTSSVQRTYVGCTNNLRRRLRQHNGEIVGGARSTRGRGPWRVLFTVEGFATRGEALRFEWEMKHRRARGSRGPSGRRATVRKLLVDPRWAEQGVVYGKGRTKGPLH